MMARRSELAVEICVGVKASSRLAWAMKAMMNGGLIDEKKRKRKEDRPQKSLMSEF